MEPGRLHVKVTIVQMQFEANGETPVVVEQLGRFYKMLELMCSTSDWARTLRAMDSNTQTAQ